MLKEKMTRKFEIDECNCHIHVRETTTIIETDTGEIRGAPAHHRFVIIVGEFEKVKALGIEKLAEHFWSETVLQEARIAKEALENLEGK